MKNIKQHLMASVADDLEGIEAALSENLQPYLKLVEETASHLLFSGGKRFRPLLMVLAARLCGYDGNKDKTYATAFEFIHAATLLHDDVVDSATLRRGKPVANSLWGGATAVLVGDYLLARALTIGASTGKLRVIDTLAEITEYMAQGEIHQMLNKGRLDLGEEEYMEVIRCKTALLIQGACRVGAIISDADAQMEAALSEYGLCMGLSFQMADDLLDYTADTKSLGKAVGADLREGKLTLPVIYALAKAVETDRAKMASIIENPDFNETDFNSLLNLMEQYGGIEYTRQKAADYIEKAKVALSIFPGSKTKDILLEVADYALARSA